MDDKGTLHDNGSMQLGQKKRKFCFHDKIQVNKTRTSKVGAISKAQKAQNIFFEKKLVIFEKNLKFSENFFLGKCRTVPKKIKRGEPLASDGFVDYVKKVQNERGDPLETKKFSERSRTVPKIRKNRKGDSVVPSGFVGYLEKGLH